MAVEKSGGGGASSSSTSAASSMDRFHKIVLSWDYLRLVADSKGAEQAKGLRRVKNTYASVAEYLAVFEPLLFEEVKAQVVQGRSDEEEEVGLDWQNGAVSSSRLQRIASIFATTESFLWILKGPPGTGKTQTILGLLSAVLHSAPARLQTN